ncbi:O-acetyl-ADP-ribose deacetylase [Psychrobacter lutiphocae]|uniref:O-acetyl-ADP-ribose deacetylase n=1 Tax=Psychrobacter lutiphocae TaxID=540500 RepID=UPI00036CB94D|nr:O-acetyl-ADP-ribose deacetylase [Psychrobacter lutiphocae]
MPHLNIDNLSPLAQVTLNLAQTDTRLSVIQADITTLAVDAIVNAANSSLLGGGGVDGAIHQAAGPQLLTYCRTLKGCHAGEAKISPGFDLPARYVIHTVGPIWRGGNHHESELLASCYQQSLQLAIDQQLNSIAFPAISTGVYSYPLIPATKIAIETVVEYLKDTSSNDHSCNETMPLRDVIFCCFSVDDANVYKQLLAQLNA